MSRHYLSIVAIINRPRPDLEKPMLKPLNEIDHEAGVVVPYRSDDTFADLQRRLTEKEHQISRLQEQRDRIERRENRRLTALTWMWIAVVLLGPSVHFFLKDHPVLGAWFVGMTFASAVMAMVRASNA